MKESLQKVFIKIQIAQKSVDILGDVPEEPERSELLTYGKFYKEYKN